LFRLGKRRCAFAAGTIRERKPSGRSAKITLSDLASIPQFRRGRVSMAERRFRASNSAGWIHALLYNNNGVTPRRTGGKTNLDRASADASLAAWEAMPETFAPAFNGAAVYTPRCGCFGPALARRSVLEMIQEKWNQLCKPKPLIF